MFDFISIGEMLIDFTPFGDNAVPVYQLNPGGAPANVACVMAKLGLKSCFIGKVGNDSFGLHCKKALDEVGCDSNYLILSGDHNTSLAFVTLSPDGDRSFSFYRNETTADVNLNMGDIPTGILSKTKIFHYGSVSLTQEPSRSTTLEAVKQAKKAGCLISYDPNLRIPLWRSEEDAKRAILEAMPLADLVKISEEECNFLFPRDSEDDAAKKLMDLYGLQMLIITKAKHGCVAYLNGNKFISLAYDVKTIDTTGAGDSFWAGILLSLLELKKPIADLSSDEISRTLSFGNALGSLVTTKRGAIAAIPTRDEITRCMAETKLLV